MVENTLLESDKDRLSYPGELTLEALAALDTYIKTCCNVSSTSRKLHKGYIQVRKYLKQPYVRELFQLKLIEKGVTPDKIADVIKSGIEAQNGIYYEGEEVAQEPNWMARQRFIQLAAEIFEVLKYNAKVDIENNNQDVKIVVSYNKPINQDE